MSGIIFCACSTLAIPFLQIVLKWCQEERKKNQVKKESHRSQDQWWVWLQGLPQLCHLLHQKARWREVLKVKVLWVCKLRNMIERETRCSPWHKSRAKPPPAICWKLALSNLLRMGRWQSLVFSRVESWWIDEWSNGETRSLPSKEEQRHSNSSFVKT